MSQEVPYHMQVSFKEKEVLDMIREADLDIGKYHGIHGSEINFTIKKNGIYFRGMK